MNRRKRQFAVSFTLLLLVGLVGGVGLWLRAQQRQYTLNRQLIDTLVKSDTKKALALVNSGADPNTEYTPTPMPSLPELVKHFLHSSPPPVNDSPTAFLTVCGALVPWTHDKGEIRRMLHGSDDAQLTEAMLHHGAHINVPLSVRRDGWTALMCAAFARRRNTFDELLQHGADVNAKNNYGETPLVFATRWNATPDMMRLLLQYRADVNAKDKGGRHPLTYALGHPAISALLLQYGADANAKDSSGHTALMYATRFPPDVVRLLLQHGADVNTKDNSGQTPLMCAAEVNATPNVMRLLLQHGADINAKDNSGQTPLMYAQHFKHPGIVALLKQAGTR